MRLKNKKIRNYVILKLPKNYTPEQIAGRIRIDMKKAVIKMYKLWILKESLLRKFSNNFCYTIFELQEMHEEVFPE